MRIAPFEIEEFPLLQEGEANFQIISAEDVISHGAAKQGLLEPDQIRVKMKVWDINGKQGVCFDYIPYNPDYRWKLGKFLSAIGMERLSKTGDIDTDVFSERAGKCVVKTDEYNGTKKTVINYYLKKEINQDSSGIDTFDDNINF